MACKRCGQCCRDAYAVHTTKPTKESEAYEKFLEFTRPKTFRKVPDGIMVVAPCEHLAAGNRCDVYNNRPQVCKDFLCEKAIIPDGFPSQPPGTFLDRKEVFMKLGEIVQARESFKRLSVLKMPPQTAYHLLKYLKLVTAESEIVEKQRTYLVYRISGKTEGEPVKLEPNSPEMAEFLVEYSKVLNTDSELKPFDMTLTTLLDILGDGKDNALSASDLAAIEPFFKT